MYPALSRVDQKSFGICLAGVDGSVYAAGDAGQAFTIMSVAKPFVLALVCAALGPEQARKKIGVNATGLPFNSLAAVERGRDGRHEPDGEPGRDRRDQPACPGDTRGRQVASSSHDGLSRVRRA